MGIFQAGDRVRFLPEWAGDDCGVLLVVNGDEGKGRVDVRPESSPLPFPPVETVSVDMVVLCEGGF